MPTDLKRAELTLKKALVAYDRVGMLGSREGAMVHAMYFLSLHLQDMDDKKLEALKEEFERGGLDVSVAKIFYYIWINTLCVQGESRRRGSSWRGSSPWMRTNR